MFQYERIRKTRATNFFKTFLVSVSLVVAPIFSLPAQADDDAIYASCKQDLKFSDSECDCVLNAVNEELSDNQRKAFVKMIQGDNAAISQAVANGEIDGQDMLFLTNFMSTTPAKCENK
ncbi:MAG: hypothetical protein AAF423_10295 [Pseudomonadota bacterium]